MDLKELHPGRYIRSPYEEECILKELIKIREGRKNKKSRGNKTTNILP